MCKIVILVDQLTNHGGIEKLVAIKANYWTTVFGHDVTIIGTDGTHLPIKYELEKEVKYIEFAINYNTTKSFFHYSNTAKLLKNTLKIQRYILKQHPDFIVVASHIPMTYILPFLYRKKTKIIKEFHFTKFYNQSNFKNTLFDKIENRYDNLVVLSKEEQQFYHSNNVVVIPNPVVVNNLTLRPNKKNVAVMVLRFAPVKRIALAMSIWAEIIKDNPDWELHIYGDYHTEYGQQMQQLLKDKKLEKSIHFKGETDNVSAVLAKSKIVLMTSEQECFPMVILEAMQQGIPTLALDVPTGPRNIIQSLHTGLLADSEDAFVTLFNTYVNDEVLQKKIAKNMQKEIEKYNLCNIMSLWQKTIFKQCN